MEPEEIGTLNELKLCVVKVEGEFVWHSHEETDDFFLVLSGHLSINLPERTIELDPGELYVVPRGVRHRPRAAEPTELLLIEPRDTVSTGDAGGPLTADETHI